MGCEPVFEDIQRGITQLNVLITGIRGFVGMHLTMHLLSKGHRPIGIDRQGRSMHGCLTLSNYYPNISETEVEELKIYQSDMKDVHLLTQVLEHPIDAIVHLAGTAFVPDGWKDPAGILDANVGNTIRLLEACKIAGYKGRFLFVSSGEVYGAEGRDETISENSILNPDTPYAITKQAAELYVQVLARNEFDSIIARPFNHIGPGQNERFVVPSFLNRIYEAKKSKLDCIKVGDLESFRDFTDVRDVVSAYLLLLEKASGDSIYNICSETNVKIKDVFEEAMRATDARLKYEVDPSLLRPGKQTVRKASAQKLKKLGWAPSYSLRDSVNDTWSWLRAGR